MKGANQTISDPGRREAVTAPAPDGNSEKFDVLTRAVSPQVQSTVDVSCERVKGEKKKRWNRVLGKFVLISYIVGLGNLVSFPGMYLTNGRLAFLIPMAVSYLFIGIPMLLIEIIIGQFSSLPPNQIFGRITPLLSSVGGAMTMVVIWRSMFFVPFMAQCGHLAYLSLIGLFLPEPVWYDCPSEMPAIVLKCLNMTLLSSCQSYWKDNHNVNYYSINSTKCKAMYKLIFQLPPHVALTPHLQYTVREIFRDAYIKETYPFVPGPTGVIVVLVVLWAVVGLLCFFGVRWIGYFASFCAITPFVFMTSCFAYVTIYKKNSDYLSILVGADWGQLTHLKTWSDAVTYTLFSLSLADGGVINIAAHNHFNNNLLIDLVLAVSANVLMSMITTATYIVSIAWVSSQIHPTNDYMASVAMGGIEAYQLVGFPEFATFHAGGRIFTFLYYFNTLILGLPSVFISLEIVVQAIYDRFNCTTKVWKAVISAVLCTALCLLSMFLLMPGGMYLMRLMLDDSMSVLALIALLEVLAFAFKYGLRNFSKDIESMLGYRSYLVRYSELVSWRFVTPISLLLAIGVRLYYTSQELFILIYFVPIKMKLIGWSMLVVVIIVVFMYFVFKLILLKRQGRSPSAVFGAHDNWKNDDEDDSSSVVNEVEPEDDKKLAADQLALHIEKTHAKTID